MSVLDNTSVEASIVAAVTPLVPIFPLVAPDQAAPPYAIYSGSKSDPEMTLSDGIPIESDHFEVTVWDVSYDAADTLAFLVRLAIIGMQYPISALMAVRKDHVDAATRLYSVVQEFHIWQPRSSA